jgi:phospholipid/cholesterol/gamma-HCH transport system substrate-binding protein
MQRNVFEASIGALVLCVCIVFSIFAYKNANLSLTKKYAYVLQAKFDNSEGIGIGSEVMIAGIKIGMVSAEEIDLNNYMAVLKLSIDKNVKIPKDSSAKIMSSGLLGGKYIAIIPGGDTSYLANGEAILYTQSSVNIENLIGKMVFGGAKDKNNAKEN